MNVCDSTTIQTIYLDECIGTSLLTINNNYSYLKEQACIDSGELDALSTTSLTISSNVTTLSTLSAGFAKAWVAFNGNSNGTGTGNREIFNSYKVTSVSSVGIGQYRINFTTGTFPLSNYVVIGTAQQTSGYTWVQPTTAFQTTNVRINIRNISGTLQDSNYVSILVYNK